MPPYPLRWRHNGPDSVSNHQPHDCLLNRLFRRGSKKTTKIRVTGLRAGNSPETGEFPAQRASYAENVSIWWRHHAKGKCFGDVKMINPVYRSDVKSKMIYTEWLWKHMAHRIISTQYNHVSLYQFLFLPEEFIYGAGKDVTRNIDFFL